MKKIGKVLFFLGCIALMTISFVKAENLAFRVENDKPKLFLIRENGKYGFIDKTGKIIVEPKFDSALSFFENGLAPVKKDGKWGFVDSYGKMVVEPQFDDILEVGPFQVPCALKGKKWFFVFGQGNYVALDCSCTLSEGFAVIYKNGKYGFVDQSGKIVITPQFEGAREFHEGLAAVKKNDKWGYIDKKGNMVIEPNYSTAYGFSDGLAVVAIHGHWCFIDQKGNLVMEDVSDRFETFSSFSEGLVAYDYHEKYGFANSSGTKVIKAQFDYACDFSEGMAAVKKDGKYGFVDKTGKMVIDPIFDDAGDFQNGLAKVEINKKWGYVDKTGKYVWQENKVIKKNNELSKQVREDFLDYKTAIVGGGSEVMIAKSGRRFRQSVSAYRSELEDVKKCALRNGDASQVKICDEELEMLRGLEDEIARCKGNVKYGH